MAGFPVAGYNFSVEYGGKEIPFQDVSGLSVEYDVEEVVNGLDNGSMIKIPKKVKYSPIVLKKGIIKNDQFKKLMDDIADPSKNLVEKIASHRKDITILLKDEKGAIVLTFKLVKAIPIKINIGKFNAQESSIAVEDLTFVYQSLKIS
jgi:phage tail-like protein